MKKKKFERFMIYSSIIIIATSSIGYSLVRKKDNDYNRYVNNTANSILVDDYNIVAHRGFSSLEVENTEKSLSLAASKDYVDMIEFDVRLTKDGKIILSHNDLLNVSAYELLRVSNCNYDELVNKTLTYFPIISFFHTLNSKEDNFVSKRNNNLLNHKYHLIGLLDAIKSCGDKLILLDIKFNNDYEKLINELKNELKDIDTSNIIFQSLDIKGIKDLKDNTTLKTQVLISRREDLKYIKEFDSIGLNFNIITYDLVKELIDSNKKVMLWTINTVRDLERVFSIVGDYYKDLYYITNYPDLILTKLHEKEEKVKKKVI
jgi:glycerophosphoryl diester phosphodiesterase